MHVEVLSEKCFIYGVGSKVKYSGITEKVVY